MLKEKLHFERKNAIEICADFGSEAGVRGYAMAWLALTNNARRYSDIIYGIENRPDSDKVYVYCNPKNKEGVVDFLTEIYTEYNDSKKKAIPVGKVISVTETVIGIPHYEYESSCDFDLDFDGWEKDLESSIYTWAKVRNDY